MGRLQYLLWRICVLSTISLIQLMCGALGKNAFKDQIPNFITPKTYHADLQCFGGESLGIMSIDAERRMLYMGGKNIFYIFDLNNALSDASYVRNYTWPATGNVIDSCTMKGTQFWECQNYIQVLLYNKVDDNLLVCGTNAQSPRCRTFSDDTLTNYAEESGIIRCPFRHTQRSTALYVDGELFTGTVAEFTARDSIFAKTVGSRVGIQTKRLDSKWLKIPEFINSFEINDWVVVFLREIAVEHVNSGEAVYSRVMKVCKSDLGGEWILEDEWTTFQKARLNCSFPGAFPFYFNYLQDAFMIENGENTTFYGVFTTGDHEIPGSAVCAFDMSTIREIFEQGQFKAQQSGSWYAVPPDDVPVPRPGACVPNSKNQPDRTLNFIMDHPLMDQSVPNDGDPFPIFDMTRADYRLVQIAVHRVQGIKGKMYNVLYLGSDDGRVLKVVLVKDRLGKVISNLLEEIVVTPRDKPEAIVNVEIITNNEGEEVLLVNTNSTVAQVPLERCSNLSACACLQDPYCVLNNLSNLCSKLTDTNTFDDQDVENIQDCPQEVPPLQTTTPVECIYSTTVIQQTTDASTPLPHTTTLLPGSTGKLATTILSTTSLLPGGTTWKANKPVVTKNKDTETTTMGNEIPGLDGDAGNGAPSGKTTDTGKPNGDDNDIRPPDVGGQTGSLVNSQNSLQVLVIFLALGWIAFIIAIFVIIYIVHSRKNKGNYERTDTDECIFGSTVSTGSIHLQFFPRPKVDLHHSKLMNPEDHKDMKKKALDSNTFQKDNGQLPQMTKFVEYQEKGTPDLGQRKNSTASDNVFDPPTKKPSQIINPMYKPPQNAYSYGSAINPLVLRHGRRSLQAGQHGVSHSPEMDKRISLSRNEGVDSSMYINTTPPVPPPRDEDRRPSGASDSEIYDSREDVWQMQRPDGQEFSPEHTPSTANTLVMPQYAGEDVV